MQNHFIISCPFPMIHSSSSFWSLRFYSTFQLIPVFQPLSLDSWLIFRGIQIAVANQKRNQLLILSQVIQTCHEKITSISLKNIPYVFKHTLECRWWCWCFKHLFMPFIICSGILNYLPSPCTMCSTIPLPISILTYYASIFLLTNPLKKSKLQCRKNVSDFSTKMICDRPLHSWQTHVGIEASGWGMRRILAMDNKWAARQHLLLSRCSS